MDATVIGAVSGVASLVVAVVGVMSARSRQNSEQARRVAITQTIEYGSGRPIVRFDVFNGSDNLISRVSVTAHPLRRRSVPKGSRKYYDSELSKAKVTDFFAPQQISRSGTLKSFAVGGDPEQYWRSDTPAIGNPLPPKETRVFRDTLCISPEYYRFRLSFTDARGRYWLYDVRSRRLSQWF